MKPYLIGSATSDVPSATDEVLSDIGLDAKIGITEGLSADFTYNTDFAQVEADERQINLTRFNLFFPEKREFSRRIGLEGGLDVPLRVGGRVTGRVGP